MDDYIQDYWNTLDAHTRAKVRLRQNQAAILKNVRLRLKLTQRELALRLGVGHTYISHLEAGRVNLSENLMLRLEKIDVEGVQS